MANPEIAALRARLRPTPPDVKWVDMRAMYDGMGKQYPLPDDVRLEAIDANGVKAEWSTAPAADPVRAILYLHGGGYVIGSIAQPPAPGQRAGPGRRGPGSWRWTTGWRPKRPTAAVDDALAGYRFLLESGLKPARSPSPGTAPAAA